MRRLFRRRHKTAEKGTTPAGEPQQLVQSPSATPSSSKTFPVGIKLLHSPKNAVVDLVFVHGLTGDREKTWTAHGASEPWPKALLPSKLPTARILAYGYDAYVTNWQGVVSQNRIGDHAWNLVTSLSSYRDEDGTNERPIIFVCHSLGGLVCKDALVKSNERPEPHLQGIVASTRGIAFLGTPHHGAGLARLAELLSRSIGLIHQTNTEIVAVLRRESEVLARIQDSFDTMVMARNQGDVQPIEISCFYEELPLPGIGQVVPQHSAVLSGYIRIGIHSNHMDMARFAADDDQGFTAVCRELRRWIKQIPVSERNQGDSPTSGYNEIQPDGLQDRQGRSARFLVPYTRNPAFVERSGILEQLNYQLGYGLPQADHRSQRRTALYGLGGVGKTQIALAYAYWLEESFPDVSVLWVHASSAERFREAYSSIAQELRVPGYDDPKADVLSLVKTWLQSKENGRWLMVIDNADNAQLFSQPRSLGKWIPECAHGSILVTTRNKVAGSRLTQGRCLIEVGKMTEGESRLLLQEKLEADNPDPDNLSSLSSRLEHLPLALVQAAAFIQETSISVDSYLQLLEKSDQHLIDLLSEEFETVGRDSEATRAVAETWILSFEQIQQQDTFAGELLSLMSLFNRQAIPLEFLCDYDEQQQGQEPRGAMQLTKALGVLKAFSFVTEDKSHAFDMHRLVQLVTQKWLVKKGIIYQFVRQAILTVSRNYPDSNHENREICGAYLAHAYAVLNSEGTGLGDENLARASLLYKIAIFFNNQSRWKEAEKFLKNAIKVEQELVGEEDPITLASISTLASTYSLQGRWKEAETLAVQVMEITKKVLGDEHPYTLTSIGSLASMYWDQGRWKEAEALEVQVIELRKKVLGDEHPDTLISISNLASMYRNQGRWKQAEALEVKVMEIGKKVLGDEHPDTLTSISNLAFMYWDQGRWKEAEALQVQVMEIRKKVLGDEHPDTLIGMNNLASTYRSQGRWKEAEALEVQVMEIRKKVLGDEHPDTLTSMNNLASTYRSQGRWKEAEALEVQAMEIRKKVLGDEHPHTLTSMNNLASTYRDLGRWKEAEALEVQAMEIRKKVLRDEHPDTLIGMNNLASTYQSQGRWKEAEALEVQVMEIRKKVLRDEHPDTLTSMNNLASTYRSQGRWKEAEALQVQAMEIRKKVLGDEHPDTLTSMNNLAFTYWDQGRWKEAEVLMQNCFCLQQQIFGLDHPHTIASRTTLDNWVKEAAQTT
ncbi:hypothetical protein MFIFM68171_05651 [Madurella fahalii]|uniref:ORC1/DEAH AAA+ ATPase domain-containing protein n=1 Tax=Madurella fahalii TaxID=1157608 RepID=A0ABQ0GCG4_9PEZI